MVLPPIQFRRTRYNVTVSGIGLLITLALLFYGVNGFLKKLVQIGNGFEVVVYDADASLIVSLVFIAYILGVTCLHIVREEPKAKNKWLGRSLLVAAVAFCVIGPTVAHNHVIHKFSDAGYIECGPFEKVPKVDRKQSIFNSRAWVLDAGDCAEAGAHPPRTAR